MITTIAVTWNFIYNILYEKWEARQSSHIIKATSNQKAATREISIHHEIRGIKNKTKVSWKHI
jgi:uncharacterized membrane protein